MAMLLHSGFYKFVVHNSKELELLIMHNRKYAAEIAHNVSSLKRKAIVERAREVCYDYVSSFSQDLADDFFCKQVLSHIRLLIDLQSLAAHPSWSGAICSDAVRSWHARSGTQAACLSPIPLLSGADINCRH